MAIQARESTAAVGGGGGGGGGGGMGEQRDCSHLGRKGQWARDSQYPMRAIGLGFSILDRILQGELRRLKWQHEEAAEAPTLGEGPAEVAQDHRNEELLAEARILRQHKSRLETRMQILEDHNKQLESQLQRLRELLLQVRLGPRKDQSSLRAQEGG